MDDLSTVGQASAFDIKMRNCESKASIRLLLLCLVLGQVVTGLVNCGGRTVAERFDDIRGLIRKELAKSHMSSIAVAVAHDGKILWEEGFGWADREKRIQATEHTMYPLASISKPITATGLMVLVQAGKIDLDRPINDYLGSAKVRARVGDAAQATVWRVTNHTSGLPLHYQFFYADEPYRPPPMDETIRRYANLVTVPGEKYEYSNLGFGILDYVIARVSGKPYTDFMREEVFDKLGLTHTTVGPCSRAGEVCATRYGSDGTPIPVTDFDHRGASAIYASAHDLIRFALFHLKAHLEDQAPILSDESIVEMQKPSVSSSARAGYGIGWAVEDKSGGYRVISHTGGMDGVTTSLRLIPSEKLAVGVLGNGNHVLPHGISEEILGVLLPKRKVQRKPNPPWVKPGPFHPPTELIGTWTGKLCTYKAELPFTLQIRHSGTVEAQLGGQLRRPLTEVRWEQGALSGQMPGDIGTEDAARRPYLLHFALKLRGNVMNGPASAITIPGGRVGNALTEWVEVQRDQ